LEKRFFPPSGKNLPILHMSPFLVMFNAYRVDHFGNEVWIKL